MARGLRHGRSKLSYSLQDLGLVDFEVAGRKNLPTLVSAKSLGTFPSVREDLSKAVIAFYAQELMLKMTADEQPNPEAYRLLVELLEFLDKADFNQRPVFPIVDRFSLNLLKSLGFSLEYAGESFRLPQRLAQIFTLLMENQYQDLPKLNLTASQLEESHQSVKGFVELILERNIKSEQFLLSV
jgi:hypothetical protein